MATLGQYEQQVAKEKESYLGYLAWYTCSDVKVDHKTLVQALSTNGLLSTIPSVPADVDVFRRVSTNAERKKLPTGNPDTFDNYLIRKTDESDPVTVRRLIVKETVNKAGKRLQYEELYYIDFHRAGSAIQFGPIDGKFFESTAADMCREITDEYQAWKGCLNSYAIREMVRRMLLAMGATLVRDGGAVYFVSEDNAASLEALEKFVDALPGGSSFHSLPLVDNVKQRKMVRRAFEAETVDAVDRLMGEINEIRINDKKISSDQYAAMLTKYQELTSKTQSYEEMLEQAMGETHSRLQLFQRSIFDLRSNVKA